MPDGKSIVASTFSGNDMPLKQFDIANGKVSVVAANARSPVAGEDAVYFVQSDPGPGRSERAQALMKISPANPQPAKVLENLPAYGVAASGNRRWLVLRDSWNGVHIFDTRNQTTQDITTGCSLATVLPDGQVIYATHSELVFDPRACASNPVEP